MEFKSLKNIETSFRQIRLFTLVFLGLCAVVAVFRRFHELFFTLAPDRAAIESNINRALFLCDKSAYHYSQDLQEKGYYNRVVAGNINQQVQVDSVVCDFDTYPYRVTTYARQMIIRESNVTTCRLVNVSRSDNNPQGFTMERFEIVENRDLRVIAR